MGCKEVENILLKVIKEKFAIFLQRAGSDGTFYGDERQKIALLMIDKRGPH